MKWVIVLCCLLAASGCSRKATPPASSNPPARISSVAALPTPPPSGNPADVVVEVEGAKLTRGAVDAETEYMLARMMDRIPPDQVEGQRQRIRQASIEQFIFRTLLAKEATRNKLPVSKEEEEQAFKELASGLPPGVTMETVMKNSPRGEAGVRDEILNTIKIKRLLEPFRTNTVDVSEQEIADFSAMYKNNLVMPELVRARHILIATAPADDEKAKADKKTRAGEVRQKLVDGGDFAELARQHSDCPSKEKGGDLGAFTRDKMVKPFSDAAFSQEVNAIGPVVETQFGYHVIQVTEHNEAGVAPRDKIADIVRNQKRQKAMRDYMDDLKSKATITYGEENVPPPENPVFSAPFPANPQPPK